MVTQSFARLPRERLDEVLNELAGRGDWYDIACEVDQDFHLVCVREHELDWLSGRVRALGGLPLYAMRPPLHSAAFAGLRRKAAEEIFGELVFAEPKLPVIADADGAVVESAEGVRAMVLDGFVRPVRWTAVVATLKRLGVSTVCVAGPDGLFGRVAATTSNFEVIAANPRLALTPRRGRGVAAPAASMS